MIVRDYEYLLDVKQVIMEYYKMSETVYFDIETTGFDKEDDKVVLISIGRFTAGNSYEIKQYFAETLEDEAVILKSFAEEFQGYGKWCSFNGLAFDEPFLQRRMEKNHISFQAPGEHIDLYRLIRPYYRRLGMERCNLKSVEKHIGIQREDQIDGGESVQLYYQYLEGRDESLKNILLLHNFEDVLNLPRLFSIVYEVDTDPGIVREDRATEKQIKYLKFLLYKNHIDIDINNYKISKKAAARVIDALARGNSDINELISMITSSY